MAKGLTGPLMRWSKLSRRCLIHLRDWDCSSSDSCSGSESDSDVEVSWEQADEPDKASRSSVPSTLRWYINGSTLVIHERRNETLFKCGRVIGPPYFPVHPADWAAMRKVFSKRYLIQWLPTAIKRSGLRR